MSLNAKLLLLTTASILALLACLVWGGPLVPWDVELAGLLGAASVYYEVRASRLPGAGFASCSFAFLLALGLTASVAPAALVALLGVMTRTLWRGHPDPGMRSLECLIGLLPPLAGLGAAAYLHQEGKGFVSESAAAALAYLCLVMLLPEALAAELPAASRVRFQAVYEPLSWIFLSCCACGLSMSLLAQGNIWWVLFLIPLVGALRDSLEQAVLLEEHAGLENSREKGLS